MKIYIICWNKWNGVKKWTQLKRIYKEHNHTLIFHLQLLDATEWGSQHYAPAFIESTHYAWLMESQNK